MQLRIQSALPEASVSHFVHSFWMVENTSENDFSSTVLPTGMVDLIVVKSNTGDFQLLLQGIDPLPSQAIIKAGTTMFSIGMKLLAVEYLLGTSIKDWVNEGKVISNAFWQFETKNLENLDAFCRKSTERINSVSIDNIDNRKKKLFELFYASEGSMTVAELSENAGWSSRQINRYFNQRFGISLKTYCNVLRSGESFKNISEGKLFPEQHFTDQNHFIKEIRKHTGATPKELKKNKDERFINMEAIKKFPKNG